MIRSLVPIPLGYGERARPISPLLVMDAGRVAEVLPDGKSGRQLDEPSPRFHVATPPTAIDEDSEKSCFAGDSVRHVRRFLRELGDGFAFVTLRHRLESEGQDFVDDMNSRHVRTTRFIVDELGMHEFGPSDAGRTMGVSEHLIAKAPAEPRDTDLPSIEKIETELSLDLIDAGDSPTMEVSQP